MWICSSCGTDNEYNVCTNCQSREEESGFKSSTPEQEPWKCSRCETEADGNFCGQCRMPRTENEVWQFVEKEEKIQQLMAEGSEVHLSVPEESEVHLSVPEEFVVQPSVPEEFEVQSPVSEESEIQPPAPEESEIQPPVPEESEVQPSASGESEIQQQTPEQEEHQQPSPQQAAHQQSSPQQVIQQQLEVAEKSGKKRLIIGVVVVIAAIALLTAVVIFAMRLILNNDRDDTRDPDTYVEEVKVDEVEEAQVAMIYSDGPYHLNVWGGLNIMELENNSMVLQVPIPPDVTMEEFELIGSTLSLGQGEGVQWFHILIELGNEQLEDDFRKYAEVEVSRTLRSHRNFGEVIDYHVYEERNVTLLIIHWEDEYGEGVSFVKISEVHGYLLVTEIGFESLENRDDFFEAYGFNNHFESIIQERFDEWGADRADATNQEEDEDGNDEELWTIEQRNSWSDLRIEFWEVSNSSFDLFFLVWDDVIIENTILEQYPNADVERLTRLHTEFYDRFDELISPPDGIDFTLPYDSEHNQSIFQQTRALILEHESFYNDFRAALEGR